MSDDVEKISKNTGWSVSKIKRIKHHVFYDDTHVLYDKYPTISTETKRFDADPEIVKAWNKLMNGNFKDLDILLLEHEYFESRIEKIFKVSNSAAHDSVTKKYDWSSRLNEQLSKNK